MGRATARKETPHGKGKGKGKDKGKDKGKGKGGDGGDGGDSGDSGEGEGEGVKGGDSGGHACDKGVPESGHRKPCVLLRAYAYVRACARCFPCTLLCIYHARAFTVLCTFNKFRARTCARGCFFLHSVL